MSIPVETRFSVPPPFEYLPDGFPEAWAERERLYALAREAARRARELWSDEATREAEKADRAIRVEAAKAGKAIPTDAPNVDRLARERVDAQRTSEALTAALFEAEIVAAGLLTQAIEQHTLPAYRIRDQLRGEVGDLLDQLAEKMAAHDRAESAAAWALTPRSTYAPASTLVPVADLPGCGGMGHTATVTRLAFVDLVAFLRERYAPPEPPEPVAAPAPPERVKVDAPKPPAKPTGRGKRIVAF